MADEVVELPVVDELLKRWVVDAAVVVVSGITVVGFVVGISVDVVRRA
jgi:hypothetical protein